MSGNKWEPSRVVYDVIDLGKDLESIGLRISIAVGIHGANSLPYINSVSFLNEVLLSDVVNLR
jgi:hypothetical protein